MNCRKQGLHLEKDCQSKPERNGYKKLRSGLLNTRESDTPVAQKAMYETIIIIRNVFGEKTEANKMVA